MRLGRLVAWLVFIPSFVAAVVTLDAGEWMSPGLFATVAAVALWLALAADRRIVRERRRRTAHELQPWSGTAIVVHLQWLGWFLINVMIVMIGALFTMTRVIAGRAGVRVSLPAMSDRPSSEGLLEQRHG